MTIRLLIADDHEVVRHGLREFVKGTEIVIVGEAATGEDAFRLAIETKPDVLLLDVVMPHGDGLSVLPRLKADFPNLPVLMLSAHDNPIFMARSYHLGAAGYVVKNASCDTVLQAIRDAVAARTIWTRESLRRVNLPPTPPGPTIDVESPLTQREMEVLARLTEGSTNKQIAQALHISYETVKEHVQHILMKIGVTDRTQAAVWAVRKGLV